MIKFFALVGFVLIAPRIATAEQSVDAAMNVLQSSLPITSPWIRMGSTDPNEKANTVKLFNQQLDAIVRLGKTHSLKVVDALIPYLDYSTQDVKERVVNVYDVVHPIPEDLQVTRSYWPAFSALLDIPGASQELMNYALDIHNPTELRVAAFHVLRYSDKSKFDAVANKFRKEFSHLGPHAELMITAIEDGSRPFSGIPPFDSTR